MINLIFFEGYLIVKDVFLDENKSKIYLSSLLNSQNLETVFQHLNGSFRFSFEKDDIVYFTSDHFSGYPLFYQLDDFKIIKNPYLEKNKRISDVNLLEFLTFGYTIGEKTIYENIYECDPGVLYSYSKDGNLLKKYVWFEYSYESKKKYKEKYLAEILTKSVKPFISENLFLPLTAGLDTRTLLAINLNLNHFPEVFSNGKHNNPDVAIAKEITEHFGLKFNLNEYDENSSKLYFQDSDFKKMVKNAFWGRSLPHDLEWISVKKLPQNSRVISGHSGDWISGSYLSKELLNLKSTEKLISYIINKNPSLTGISSKKHKNIIFNSVKKYISEKAQSSLLSTSEIFEFENHQRKYNINSAWIYRGEGKESYLPFFDRRLISLFKDLRISDKINEKFYIETLKAKIFINNAQDLSQIKTSRSEFYSQPKSELSFKSKLVDLINTLDWKRKRKIFSKPNQRWEEVISLFDENPREFYSKKIKDAFPEISKSIKYLETIKATESASHLKIISNYRISQIQINGLFVLKMLPYILEIK